MNNDQETDLKTREIAQEAKLDMDMESMVPPLWGRTTTWMALAFLAIAVVFMTYVFL